MRGQTIKNIIIAVILRNIRTRFYGNGLGYLIAIAWPLVHILVLISVFYYSGRIIPFGESAVVYVATGVVPFLAFMYVSRFMMIYSLSLKPLLYFPEVKLIDVFFASAILEAMSCCCVVLVLAVLAIVLDIDFYPRDIVEASMAMLASVLLGLAFGLFNGVIAFGMPIWATAYTLVTMLLYVTSGVFFVGSALPNPLREYASYLPTLLIVEWMRSAYYDGYSDQFLDKFYLIEFLLCTIALGLLVERLMRGYLLSHR